MTPIAQWPSRFRARLKPLFKQLRRRKKAKLKSPLKAEFGRLVDLLGKAAQWTSVSVDGRRFMKRPYPNYEEYLAHQKIANHRRFHKLVASHYDESYRKMLRERLQGTEIPFAGKKVLCLGARLGTEVKAFLDLGAFAVGIDLEPLGHSRHVLYGDFHRLQFASGSTDVVFTNAFDHVYDPARFLSEIGRVLASDGRVIMEAIEGREKREQLGFYESFWWDSLDDLIHMLEGAGFGLERRESIKAPFRGEFLVLRRSEGS